MSRPRTCARAVRTRVSLLFHPPLTRFGPAFGSLGMWITRAARRCRARFNARSIRTSVEPSPITRRRSFLSLSLCDLSHGIVRHRDGEGCTMKQAAPCEGVARARSRARLRLADDYDRFTIRGARDKASLARRLLNRGEEKHTQRAAWRNVAASRMADWRRADDSRSVSALGRGDRC